MENSLVVLHLYRDREPARTDNSVWEIGTKHACYQVTWQRKIIYDSQLIIGR